MTGFRFATPAVLYLLWLVPVVGAWWFLILLRKEQSLSRFVSPKMLERLNPESTLRRDAAQAVIFLVAFFLMIGAAARPQWGTREEIVLKKSRDLVIALDVSRSMLAADVHPNRLERAKADILDLIRELSGDRIALLAFRKTGVLLCPLTTDHGFVRQTLDMISTESAPRGETDLGDAIRKAIAAFEPGEGSHRAIILISDGEDLAGHALDAAEEAGKAGIPIFTIGIGSRAGSKIPDSTHGSGKFLRHGGEDVLTKLNDSVLYAIAEKSGGAYVPLETAGLTTVTLGTLYRDHLRRVAARETAESLQRRYIERYQIFLFPGVLLMLIGLCMSRGRPTSIKQDSPDGKRPPFAPNRDVGDMQIRPTVRPVTVVLVCALISWIGSVWPDTLAQSSNIEPRRHTVSPPAQQSASDTVKALSSGVAKTAPSGHEAARAAQKLYRAGQYEEAARLYIDAAKGMSPAYSRDFRHNAAVSLYRAGRYKEAADIMRALALEDSTNARFYEGLGEALFRAAARPQGTNEAQRLSEKATHLRAAGEAFRQALRAAGGSDKTAQRNLSAALARLPDAEREARQAELLARYESASAPQIADQMLTYQRDIVRDAALALTNDSPSFIDLMEKLAERQAANADLWIPLKSKLLQALAASAADTNIQQQAGALAASIEATRDIMRGAAASFRNLDMEGYAAAKQVEDSIYLFWKAVAPFDMLLKEDIIRQTNVLKEVAVDPPPDALKCRAAQGDQDEAADLTRLFIERFSQAVPEAGLVSSDSAAATNNDACAQGGISAETRRQILDLANGAESAQKDASRLLSESRPDVAAEKARQACEMLLKIQELLPKSASSSASQKEEQQKQEQQQENQETGGANNQQVQNPQEQQQPEPAEQQSEPRSEEQEAGEAKEEQDGEQLSKEEVRRLLEKALNREKQYREEKERLRTRYVAPSPTDKDW